MKPLPLQRHLLALVALALFSLPVGGRASTIFWANNFPDLLFDSAGNALDASYTFELGSFGAFVPTVDNINQWVNNWTVFERAYEGNGGFDVANQNFSRTVDHTITGGSSSTEADPLSVFAQGEVAYVWIFNIKERQANTEWALVTDGDNGGDVDADWLFPDPADILTGYAWSLADADELIFGGLNNTQGAGGFTANPGNFTIQTATVPVPEPSSGLLMFLSASIWVIRRKARGSHRHLTINPS